MLWIEPGLIVSCAALGGMIGGLFVSFAYVRGNKHIHFEKEKMSDDLWRIKGSMGLVHQKIDAITKTISTILVNKPVSKSKNFNNYKGHD